MGSSNGMLALVCLCLSHVGKGDLSAHTLSCAPAPGGLEVSWVGGGNADQYDLQMGVPGSEDPIGGHHLDGNETSVVVEYLIPGQNYWFQLMPKDVGHKSNSSWKPMSKKHKCSAASGRQLGDSPRRLQSGYFSHDMIRMHTYADGLTNRNSANAKGEAWLLNKGWKAGLECTLAMYKVYIKEVSIPFQVTPHWDKHYANYMSCNGEGASYRCAPIVYLDALILGVGLRWLLAQNNHYSKDHVGMGYVMGTGGGRWYSTPQAGEGEGKAWYREKQYRTAKCHQSMSASDIEKALSNDIHQYLQPWGSDVSAFADVSDSPAADDGKTNMISASASPSSSPTVLV